MAGANKDQFSCRIQKLWNKNLIRHCKIYRNSFNLRGRKWRLGRDRWGKPRPAAWTRWATGVRPASAWHSQSWPSSSSCWAVQYTNLFREFNREKYINFEYIYQGEGRSAGEGSEENQSDFHFDCCSGKRSCCLHWRVTCRTGRFYSPECDLLLSVCKVLATAEFTFPVRRRSTTKSVPVVVSNPSFFGCAPVPTGETEGANDVIDRNAPTKSKANSIGHATTCSTGSFQNEWSFGHISKFDS